MGKYIKGKERDQLVLFPTSLEDIIDDDNEVRVIDAFVDSLDMEKLGFQRSKPNHEGKPGYDPKDMLKLYLYGYRNKIRSSRKLMRLTETNVEVMWLIKQLTPDFRSISDFRKNNVECLKGVFLQFNLVCKEVGILETNVTSQDGTKIRAVNAKDKNYTLNKIDDKIERIKERIEEYLTELDREEMEEKEKLVKIKELEARKKLYESYQREMEQKGVNQKSITDPESKLMKDNGAFHVCYNLQTLVSVGSNFVLNYQVTDKPADFGSMMPIVEETEEMYESKVEEIITDNGYSDRSDMIKCLENGTFPEVMPEKGEEGYILETEYEETEITEEIKNSKKQEDIKKCLRAGVIPKIYEGRIESIEVKEVVEKEYETLEDVDGKTEEELRDKAMHEEIFIRDIEKNKVFCPGGCILRQKSERSDGIRYCNKLACKNCKNPCTKSTFKEVTFREGQTVLIPNKKRETMSEKEKKKLSTENAKRKGKKIKKKKVLIKVKIDKEKRTLRMCTSEHNHGSMKRCDDAGYMLLKGRQKVTGEVALYFCAYNIRRAVNVIGVKALLEYFEKKKEEKMTRVMQVFKKFLKVFTMSEKCGIILAYI